MGPWRWLKSTTATPSIKLLFEGLGGSAAAGFEDVFEDVGRASCLSWTAASGGRLLSVALSDDPLAIASFVSRSSIIGVIEGDIFETES